MPHTETWRKRGGTLHKPSLSITSLGKTPSTPIRSPFHQLKMSQREQARVEQPNFCHVVNIRQALSYEP